MFFSLSVRGPNATDLGYLLHKHPAKVQAFALNFGTAHIFYPSAAADECTAVMAIEFDNIGVARARQSSGAADHGLLSSYVNDRPFVASSFLSVAIAQVFGSALNGLCNTRPQLVGQLWPMSATLAVVPCRRGGERFLRELFEPLGYALEFARVPLDPVHPEWGESPYWTMTLSHTLSVQQLLAHLYVLIPVLDDDKHYWVGRDEVDKLLKHGSGWLEAHPAREQISLRYLRRMSRLANDALTRLAPDVDTDAAPEVSPVEASLGVEVSLTLHEKRLQSIAELIVKSGAKRILDLGCGEGKLLRILANEPSLTEIVGVEVSHRAREIANQKINRMRLTDERRSRVKLFNGALTYRDTRLAGYDAAAIVEVIEHLDPSRLESFEQVVFEHARPGLVFLSTPNAEYNATMENLPAGQFRHADHRFEWSRAEFETWGTRVAAAHGYGVAFAPLGPEHPSFGALTQLAIFTRA